MKIGITGHTKGIGKKISDYFLKNNHEVIGFSRSSGYDISKESDRKRIIAQINFLDIFVNNAYNNFDNSQELLLKDLLTMWKDQEKIIINVSSRWTDQDHIYSIHKRNLDNLCEIYKNSKVYVINLKPGLTDTDRVKNIKGDRMIPQHIVDTIDFVLKNVNNFRVHSISFGK